MNVRPKRMAKKYEAPMLGQNGGHTVFGSVMAGQVLFAIVLKDSVRPAVMVNATAGKERRVVMVLSLPPRMRDYILP